jgi:D-glycero-alpha-D-manno-heptose-7-phosphate kinase
MIISRTPFRISFAGGGSDFAEYYREGYGAVLSATIDKYVFLSMHPIFGVKGYHLKYYNNEIVNDLNKIKHPIIKEVFRRYGITGVDFNSSSDIPSGTGLGSSSSFTVGLVRLCSAYINKYLSREEIADIACDVEINGLGSPVGKQDQYASAVGGMNFIKFNADDSVVVEKITLPSHKLRELEDSLILFYLGNVRDARSVLTKQKINIKNNLVTLNKMVKLAEDLKTELNSGNIDTFGNMLHAGWCYKKELADNVSNGAIDNWYDIALEHGATGGKVLGAGNGGFLLLFAPHGKAMLRSTMRLYELPFKFDDSGAIIIY